MKANVILAIFLIATELSSSAMKRELTVELEPIEGVSKRTRLGYQPRSLKELSATALNRPVLDALTDNTPQLQKTISEWKQKVISKNLSQDFLNIYATNLVRDAIRASQATDFDKQLWLLFKQEPVNSENLQIAILNAFATHQPQLLTHLPKEKRVAIARNPHSNANLVDFLEEMILKKQVKNKGLQLRKYLNTQTNTEQYLISKIPIADDQLEHAITQAKPINNKITIMPDATEQFPTTSIMK